MNLESDWSDRQWGVNSFCSGLQGTARIFLLTKKSVVLADQKTGQVKASVPLPDLASVSVSTQNDGLFALKLKEVREACCGLQFLLVRLMQCYYRLYIDCLIKVK